GRDYEPIDNRIKAANHLMDAPPIPYYPGREPLVLGAGVVQSELKDENELVHPLVNGAEAYYRYEVGDSLTLHLGEGQAIRLIELRVRPRFAIWNLVVGSMWFDVQSMQMVR